MSPTYDAQQAQVTKVTIGAGTAIKFGFFAAFGIVLFSLIVSVIMLVIGLVFYLATGAPLPHLR